MVNKTEEQETIFLRKRGEDKGLAEGIHQYSDGTHKSIVYKLKKRKRKGKKLILELEEYKDLDKEKKQLVKDLIPMMAKNFTAEEFVKDYLTTKTTKSLKMIKARLNQGGKIEKKSGCVRLVLYPKDYSKKKHKKNIRSKPYDLRLRG